MHWRLGVAGDPIAHSLSPQLHEAGLRLAGLEGSSERFLINEQNQELLVEYLGARIDALSITMPLKARAYEKCDGVTPVAERLGVVNSIRWVNGRIEGHCTDGTGLVHALRAERGISVEGAQTVVLGSGGAATAIIDAFFDAGASSVTVLARNTDAVRLLNERFPSLVESGSRVIKADIVVNTTPSSSRSHPLMFDIEPRSAAIAIDITYDPIKSSWLQAFEEIGFETMNGLPMLAYQAALQMEWWWGQPISGNELLGALK